MCVTESTVRAIIPESRPSYIISDPVTAGLGASVGILVLALITGAIYFIYRIYHRKASIITGKCVER